jgi:hypothetical protein
MCSAEGPACSAFVAAGRPVTALFRGRMLCGRPRFFPLNTAPVVRSVVSPVATALRMFPRGTASPTTSLHLSKDCILLKGVGQDSIVGIASRHRLHGPEIEVRWRARFSTPVQTSPGANPASYTMGSGSFPGGLRPGRGGDHPPHLMPRLKKE